MSFGGDCTWAEARKYGFISAGGGNWYSQTLRMLSPGDRVWVKIPQTGYVGVGRVTETVQFITDFKVPTSDGDRLAVDVLSTAPKLRSKNNDPEQAEYFVRVEWLETVAESDAFNEVGLFGNQNTVCRPQTPRWPHTIERLKTCFKHCE